MNRILVVNINWLGDAIFSTPVFSALKRAYPKARISCLCVPRVREVLRHCQDIDELIVYNEDGTLWNKIRMILRLKRRGFDAAFLLHRSQSRALLVYLAGIPLRIGYNKMKMLLTHPVDMVGAEGMHRSDYYLRVLEQYGIDCTERVCRLKLAEADVANLDMALKKRGINPSDKVVVLNAGGNWKLKRWPIPYWIELTKRLQTLGIKIVFSGAVGDKSDAQKIIEHAEGNAIDLTGQTSLGESLALFRRAAVVVSGDSGPLHLANSVGANVVGIFGPTRFELTGPRGAGRSVILFKNVGCNHAACYHLACRSNVCMQKTEVDDVVCAVQKFTG
jgi:heptosyltransferase II